MDGVRLIAMGSDGNMLRAEVKEGGQYRIAHVPAGTYTLTFETACGVGRKVEKVVVADGEATPPSGMDEIGCYGLF